MKAESKTAPARISIEYCENMAEIILSENILLIDKEGEGFYQYDTHRITISNRPNLEQSVDANFNEWLLLAKENQIATPSINERVTIVETVQGEVIRILSEVLI